MFIFLLLKGFDEFVQSLRSDVLSKFKCKFFELLLIMLLLVELSSFVLKFIAFILCSFSLEHKAKPIHNKYKS